MSQRQVIARSRRRACSAASSVIARAQAPAIQHCGRGALLCGTAFAALVACGLFGFSDRALAQSGATLPTGGVVVGGSATITQSGTSQLTINQSTDRGVIDWRSFSIGQGNRVDFVQPGRTSVTLNRVTGPDPSVIAGSLTATGQIVLVNQAGVMFAGGAQVNVESLIASTANVANPQAFMAGGRIAFDQAGANPNARVVNDGSITVRDGGLVALLGPSAANNGVINAKLGRVTIGGAETFTVDLNGDGLVNFAVGKPVSQTPRDADGKALALASNTGTINADGGVVAITASAARGVVDGVVNVQGRINARTVTSEGGVIVFGGGESTQVNVGGTIDVSGAGATQKGGTVHVTASKVAVQSTARINASGGAGGGTVLVGGGKQGAGPIANAKTTTVAKGAQITADATAKGNGGTVIVWADNATVFAGAISAKGGPQGGDGGFAEVSGKVYLSFDGMVDLRATTGFQTGTLLLDPSDITISNGADSNIDITGGTITGTANASNIKASTIEGLLTTANVIVDAAGGAGAGTGSITVNNSINAASTNTLTFNALTDITLNANVTNTGGAISFVSTTGQLAGAGGAVNASTVTFSMGGKVTLTNANNTISNISGTAGGAVSIVSDAYLTVTAGGVTSGAATSVSLTATGASNDIVVGGAISGTGVTLTADRAVGGTGAVSGGTGAVTVTVGGNLGINLNGTVTGTGLTVTAGSGPVTVNNVNNVFNSFTATGAIGGPVNVVHKGALTINATNAGANAASFTTNTAGKITLAGNLDSTGGVTLNAAGELAIQAKINAGAGNVGLSGASITQTAAGIITAAGLSVNSAGNVDLSQATSAVATIAGSAANLAFLESDGFSIGTVNSIDGLTITASLQLQAGGTINQTKAISAAAAAIRATAGNVNLTGATNSLVTFAASAAGAVALTEANDVQVGSVGAVGALTALDGITATGGVSIRTLAGSVTQTGTGVITAGATGLAVSVTGGNIALDTATNATSLVAFTGGGTIAYKTSSDLAVGEVAQLGNNAKVTGATATTSLALTTTGAATSILQTKAISAPTLTLATGAAGAITLTDGANLIGAVQGSGTWGTGAHAIVDSDGGLNVGPITSSGDVALTTSGGGLTVTGATNVGAKTLALTANGDNTITATAAAITAGTLTLETGAGGGASIQTAAHDVATIRTAGGGVGTGGMVFKQSRALGTTVGPITSAGAVSINDVAGDVTASGAISVTNADVTLNASAGKLDINAGISAGSGVVALLANGEITQAVTNAGITAGSLLGVSTTKSVSLAPTGVAAADVNTVNTFAGLASGGSVSFRNSATFTVGKVNTTSGITAGASVSLQVNAAGGTINQSAGADGAIVTPTLNLTTNGGSVTINSASNDIAALGTVSLGAGTFVFSTGRAAGFNVGAVTANGGINITNTAGDLTSTAAITSDGDIALRSTIGALSLGGTVTSSNGGITLRSAGALNTGAFLVSAPTAVTGDLTLISDTSTVTIGAGGATVGDTLTLQIGAGLTLNVAGAITATSVALHADIIEISAAINATGTIFLAPVTAGTAVTVGGPAAAGFVIDNTELTFLTSASALTIGKQSTGTTTAGAITVAAATVGNATLNLFSTAGISQTGLLTVGGGTGTLNITAAGTVSLNSSGVTAGKVGGSTTSGNFAVVRQSGVAGALSVTGVTTAGGEISVRNFAGDLNIDGALISNGGNILAGTNNSNFALNLNANIDAGAGAIALFSSTGGISQSAGNLVSADLVATVFGTTGGVSLASATNAITGNVTLNAGTTGGDITFSNSSGYTVGGITGVSFAIFGGASLNAAIGPGLRAPGGTVTLNVANTVTQAAGASDLVSANTLSVVRVGGANPTVTLGNAGNAVTNVGGVSLGTGSLTLVDVGGLTITGAATAGGGYSVTTDGGSLVQNAGAVIDTSAANGTITLKALNGGFPGASVTLNDNVNAGTGQVTLRGVASISQGAGAITAGTVDAVTTGFFGGVTLTSATNAFDTVIGSSAGLGGFSATSTRTLTVGATGVTATGGQVSLTSIGAASDLAVNGVISAAGQAVTLTAGRDITQSAAGGIAAGSLRALATAGSVDLTAGATNNAVTTIAGQSNGDLAYTDGGSTALTIGTVTTVGITSTAGDITVKATKTGATLSATQAVKATGAGGDVTLQSAGDLTFTAALTANKRVTLVSTAGSVNQGSAAGVITGAELLANAANNVDLSTGGHSVGATGFAATATTGYVAFLNNTGLNIDSVGGTNGVTAGGSIFIGVSTGDLTQTATGVITAGAGLALFAFTGSITFDQQNLITGNVAVVSSPNANVTIRNKGNLNVGLVGPVTVFGGGSFSADGIAASTAAGKFVSLISDTGVITQSAAASSRVLGSELRVNTTNKNATLTNTSNSIVSVGNSDLGAGRLTVFDGVGDLTLSNPVVANGGVVLTTQTTFNLPGTITVANGDISLTSVTGSIALSSTLSAVNGQIQLDAGGAGTITQTGGTITANTLIARAPGSVTLSQANNDVGTVTGKSTSGTFTYVDKTAVTIGSLVDSSAITINGITTTNQDIIVLAGAGGGAGGIAVNQAVNAGTATVRMQTSTGNVTQAAAGKVTANTLLVNAINGSINLAGATNAVTNVAGKAGGSFRLLTSGALNVTTIAADAGALTTAATGMTSASDMAIQTGGDLVLSNGLNAGPGTLRIRTAGGGGVSQAATGNVVANALLIDADGSVALTSSANNDVDTIAGRSTGGTFRYQDKNGFTVGTVGADGAGLGPMLPIGPLTGVTTAGGEITLAAAGLLTINEAINAGFGGGLIRLQTGAGDLTQGINGTITGGSLLAISTGGMVNLTGATNTVTGIAGRAFTSFLFQNSVGYSVTNTVFPSDGIVAAATGITANSGGGATPFVVDLAVASGTLAINGPVSSANGMIVYRRAPAGAPGAINVGGAAGNPGNDISTAKLVIIDHTGASPLALYGATPGVAAGGLFTVPTPATGFSPLLVPGNLTGGSSTIGELNGLNSTVYFFATTATILSAGGGGSSFGLLGIYGNSNTVNLTTSVRSVDPNQIRAVTDAFTEPLAGGPLAAFFVRRDGLANATEQFNSCPIGTINCVVFTSPIAAPATSTDDVVIGVGGAPLDDSSVVLVNQGNEDLIIDAEQDEEKKKKKRDDDEEKPQ